MRPHGRSRKNLVFLRQSTRSFTSFRMTRSVFLQSHINKVKKPLAHYVSILLICASGIVLIALQLKSAGWILLALSGFSLFFAEKIFAKDILLIIIALALLGVTPINTDISIPHMLVMGMTLILAVAIPYFVSRFIYKDYLVRFPWHHGRKWNKREIFYIGVTALISYFLLPYYLKSTGAYLNWSSAIDGGSIIRLFIGTNGLGIWDELFFVSTILGILRRYFSFSVANISQSVLFTSFLYELGFTNWGFIFIFIFALVQGYVFKKTESLLYVIMIHLTLDFVLFLAIIHSHHPSFISIFIT